LLGNPSHAEGIFLAVSVRFPLAFLQSATYSGLQIKALKALKTK
jgi:hypothetical protein